MPKNNAVRKFIFISFKLSNWLKPYMSAKKKPWRYSASAQGREVTFQHRAGEFLWSHLLTLFSEFLKILTYIVPKFAASLRFTRIITLICYVTFLQCWVLSFFLLVYNHEKNLKNWWQNKTGVKVKNHSQIELSKSTKCLTNTL